MARVSRAEAQGFRAPAERELLFSCVAKRKVTKREGHPAWRLPGILPGKSVRRRRAFRPCFLHGRKGIDLPVDAPAGLIVPTSPPHKGPIKSSAHPARFPEKPSCCRIVRRTHGDENWRHGFDGGLFPREGCWGLQMPDPSSTFMPDVDGYKALLNDPAFGQPC